MKGIITKTEDNKWIIKYSSSKVLPLHPEDVNYINKASHIFDDAEARRLAYPDVKFNIVHTKNIDNGNLVKYAKLINEERINYKQNLLL